MKKPNKYERIELQVVNDITFKLVIPTKINKEKYPLYYIECYFNGKQHKLKQGVRDAYLDFVDWVKENQPNKEQKKDALIRLFQSFVNQILSDLDTKPTSKASKKITIYSNALDSINAFFKYQENQFKNGDLTGIANYSDRNKKLNFFFTEVYPNVLLKELSAVVWDDFRTFLKGQGKANSTINQYITYVKSLYNWLINFHEIPIINHTNKLKKLDTSKQEDKYKELSNDTIREFFEIVKSDPKWLRLELITRLVAENTIRPVQVRNIQAKYINFDGGTIEVFDRKGKRWRTITVSNRVKEIIHIVKDNTLKAGKTIDGDDYLIGGRNQFKTGLPYTQNMVKDLIVEIFRKAYPQFKTVNIYDFKHTSITKASTLGNLVEVQKRAGHRKITTTQIYDRGATISRPITIEELIEIK